MQVILQRLPDDCDTAAIATATGKTYEEVYAAQGRRELPLGLNDPVWGNPASLYATLVKLGMWKRNITWTDMLNQKAAPGKTIILVHHPESPTLSQHLVVLASYGQGDFNCFWGDRIEPRFIAVDKMKELFLHGWPNCAFEIIADSAWRRFLRWIRWED